MEKKAFSTKLSLPKFIDVAKLLTNDQRRLVKSIGFHHLLDIQCDSVPRGICLWLAKHFNVKTRSVELDDGSKFKVTPQSFHEVLGIPIGGTVISKKCDDSLKKLIAEETNCKGNTPTINELKSLLTPHLAGDKFKRIFTLFAIGSLLCPSSYDCISADYYSAVEFADQISSYDWCSAVLDKLTNSIDFYQRTMATTSTTTLGGCILALVIIYFEKLDIRNHTIHEVVPRLKFWSTDMIKAFETLDAKDVEHCIFGRLPFKDTKQTFPLRSDTTSKASTGSSHQALATKCISGSCCLKPDYAILCRDIANEIASAIEPILFQYCDKLHATCHCATQVTNQDSLLAEQKVLPDRGKSAYQPNLIPAHMINKTTEHHQSSKLVTNKDSVASKGEVAGTSDVDVAKGDSTVIQEQSMPPQVQLNIEEEKLSFKVDKTVQEGSGLKGHATSSFLDVPSFSQDSTNTCTYHDPSAHPLQQQQLSDSSNLEQETEHLKPCLRMDEKGMNRVFANDYCSDSKPSEIAVGAADHNGESSTSIDHQQAGQMRTPEKVIGIAEFDFFGHGLDSDFQVIPPTEARTPSNQYGIPSNLDSMLSSPSSKK